MTMWHTMSVCDITGMERGIARSRASASGRETSPVKPYRRIRC